MRSIGAPMSASASPEASPATAALSPWHSPVPYLFGGLAAMLGLIALALLILACSYWKLNNYLGAGHASSAGDGDGSKSPAAGSAASPSIFADLVAVVMAGENMPTFLAAPIGLRAGAYMAGGWEGSPETAVAEDEGSRGKAEEGVGGEQSRRHGA